MPDQKGEDGPLSFEFSNHVIGHLAGTRPGPGISDGDLALSPMRATRR
ncbi:hypothetical protein [Celeribacter neptunius]|nr:hypothetical protein [Celeribacter neptunius]